MKIKELPMVDRPREKLIKYGPQKLSTSELIAVILSSGKKGENVLQLSKRILNKYPNNQLVDIPIKRLIGIEGIGATKACQIVACFELGKRLLKNKTSRLIMSPKDVWEDLKDLRDNKKEHFIIFYLDNQNQVIKKEVISIGTINSSLVHPREVFEPAVKNLASQIIIAHNHPSGESQPSDKDLQITKRLIEAGKILGIEVIDHVIVTKNNFFSFREKGIISDQQEIDRR